MRLITKKEIDKIDLKLDMDYKKREDKDNELTELANTTELTRIQKGRIKDLKSQMEEINGEINTLKSEKDTLNARTERNIRDHKKSQEQEGKNKKSENEDNSFFFVIISTLIELVILFGVYFNEYFKFRSYTDFKQKIEKDENFQRWHIYNELLGVIFNEDTKMNDKLPSMKTI